MLAALALAACLTPPLFDNTGPVCSPSRALVECGCTECFDWSPVLADPIAGTPAAAWYQVLRQNPDLSSTIVGSTLWRNHDAFVDEFGDFHGAITATRWCFAWDAPFPVEGQTYSYQVRACVPGLCGAYSSSFVQYTAAPYACFAGGVELPCYPGDPLTH